MIYIYWEVIPLGSHCIQGVSPNTSDGIFPHVVELAQKSRLKGEVKGMGGTGCPCCLRCWVLGGSSPKQLTEVSLEADSEQKMKLRFLKSLVARSPSAYSCHPSGLYP